LYAEEHSNSSTAFDSLAEAYFIKKQYDLAKQNYKKYLVLNLENDNVKKMLVEIEKLN
jgi:hypothetical protein